MSSEIVKVTPVPCAVRRAAGVRCAGGRVLSEVRVESRHPRNRKDTAFQAMVDRVYGAITGRAAQPVAPVAPTRALPHARLVALGGLLEKVAADNGRSDLPRLAQALGPDLDALRGEFGDETAAQLDIAVDWGRFADLYAYDKDTNELFLES